MSDEHSALDVVALTAALRQHRDKDQRFTPPLVTDDVTGRSRYATSSEFAADLAAEYGKQLLYRRDLQKGKETGSDLHMGRGDVSQRKDG